MNYLNAKDKLLCLINQDQYVNFGWPAESIQVLCLSCTYKFIKLLNNVIQIQAISLLWPVLLSTPLLAQTAPECHQEHDKRVKPHKRQPGHRQGEDHRIRGFLAPRGRGVGLGGMREMSILMKSNEITYYGWMSCKQNISTPYRNCLLGKPPSMSTVRVGDCLETRQQGAGAPTGRLCSESEGQVWERDSK